MQHLTKSLAISVVLFFTAAFCAHADDSRVDAFPYSNFKIFSHWAIACNNLEECSALGSSEKIDHNMDDQAWYITTKWHKDSDIISFLFSDYMTDDEKWNDISVELCDRDKQCRFLDANDQLQISAKKDTNYPVRNIEFVLNTKKLPIDSYINYNTGKEVRAENNTTPIYLKDLLKNRNSIKINYLSQLGGQEKIYKLLDGEGGAIAANDLNKFYPEYKPGAACEDPGNNSVLKYENGDKFLFIYCNEVNRSNYGVIVAKYDGKIYKSFNVADEATYNAARGMAEDNTFGGTDYEDDASEDSNNGILQVSSIPAGHLFHCGVLYDFAYNGKKFIIEKIRYMPVCMTADPADWPVVYQRPS